MKPFEINNDDSENLKDALNRSINRVFVPGEEELYDLEQRIVESEIHDAELLLISNIDELQQDPENWEFSEIPGEASFIALNLLITELMGESELVKKTEGFTLAQSIDALKKHAFVQCTELNLSNITACLRNGGDIIAYFSEELWRSCFGKEEYISYETPVKSFRVSLIDEIPGMRVIKINDVRDGVIICDDYSMKNGKGIKIDYDTFDWLSQNGMMLEVYK